MEKIAEIEFEDFILRGVKAPLAINALKQWAMFSTSSNEKMGKKFAQMIAKIQKTLPEDEQKELQNVFLNVQNAGEKSAISEKLKEYLGVVMKNNPEEFAEFLDAGLATQAESQSEEQANLMIKALTLCLDSLQKDVKILDRFTVQDQYKLIAKISSAKENLIDYNAFFFAIPELSQLKANEKNDPFLSQQN